MNHKEIYALITILSVKYEMSDRAIAMHLSEKLERPIIAKDVHGFKLAAMSMHNVHKARALYGAGLLQSEIAKWLNLTQPTVSAHINRNLPEDMDIYINPYWKDHVEAGGRYVENLYRVE